MDETMEEIFSSIKEMKVTEFPIRKVPTIHEDLSCMELIDSFLIDTSPITIVVDEDGKYTGVLTIKDILPLLQKRKTDIHDALMRSRVLSCITACDLAKRQLPPIKDDDEISTVANLMEIHDTVFLPRVKDRKGEILGVIALMDILGEVKSRWDCACDDEEAE